MAKRKKHSITKRHANYSRALLHRLHAVVVWVAGQHNNACVLANLKSGKLITMGPELAGAIGDVAHDWSIYCAVFGRTQTGDEYMQGASVLAPRCYQSQLAEQLTELHTNLLRSMNPQHRCGVGWVACPWGEDLAEDIAGRLFEQLGGWEAERIEFQEAI